MFRSVASLILLLLGSLPVLLRAEERRWQNWMGDAHAGVSDESDWSVDWPEFGLPIAWQREIGIGFSSVSIADGRLFTMGHQDGKETVYCLNVDTGEIIWTHTYRSELVANLYEGGPGSTPTIDGDQVYTLGKEGQLFCFRVADGKVLWQRELQADLGVRLPEWGFNSSPTVLGDQLILQGGRVVSYDKRSGELNWKTPKHTPGYGSAAVIRQNGKPLLATLDSDGLRVHEASDGSLVDAFPWASPFRTNSTTPIVKDDTIYISTAYGVGCGLFRLADGKLELIYDNRDMRNHFNNSVLYQGYLYGFDGNSNFGRVVKLVCMNHQTGEVAWQQNGLGCGSLMIAGGKLVILSEDGQLVVAEATAKEFKELARTSILAGRCWTVPVLLNGHVYARNAAGKLVSVKLP